MKKGVDWSERNYLIKEGGLAWLWVLNLLPAFNARICPFEMAHASRKFECIYANLKKKSKTKKRM